jgi:transposase
VTQQELIFAEVPVEKFSLLTKEELIIYLKGEQSLRIQLQKDVEDLRAFKEELKQKSYTVSELLITVKNKFFGKSSERSAKPERSGEKKRKTKRVLLPSERYPDAPLIERHVLLDVLPSCACCESQMHDTGMTEDSEFLTAIPKQFFVVRQKRHKYGCGKCHGDMKTAPAPPKIVEGGAYSDEMVIDASLSKYCDLVPMERYATIAGREGLKDLPPQSLIEGSHRLSCFVKPAYDRVKAEITSSVVWHADETPHRMLEGSAIMNWYLWGFSTPTASYFECHSTRSGDVAYELLLNSRCRFLVSDVFSGYGKAVREANQERAEQKLELIVNVYCNAHSRRKFKEADKVFEQLIADAKSAEEKVSLERAREEVQFFLKQYRRIYRLEALAKKHPRQHAGAALLPADRKLKIRERMKKYFEKMRDKALRGMAGYSAKSSFGKAMNYFSKNYEGLTRFLGKVELPIDNNPQERLLRNPVIGRKTWYGTHSKLGAQTAAILFSLVESCKLNKINPREYFKNLVAELHQAKPAFTPWEYKQRPQPP